MSLGLWDERRRRRRQFRQTVFRWLLAFAVVAGAGIFAYRQGTALAERGVAARDEQIRALVAQVDELRATTDAQADQIAAERGRAEEWRQRYERDVATGETRELFDLVQSKLTQGVGTARLRWVVERTEARRDCDPRPQVKRVLVQTPISPGARAPTAFAGTGVSVTIGGLSARNSSGAPEAWFDAKLPVTFTVTPSGGRAVETTGPLPLTYSVLEGDREFRFAINAAARGYAQVSLERCRFP